MSNEDNSRQLSMDFTPAGKINRFADALHNGRFVLAVEAPAPEVGSPDPAPAPEQLAALENEVMRIGGLDTVLVIPDRGSAWRGIEHAIELPVENRDRHLVYLSGAGTSHSEAERLVRLADSCALTNLVAVSGDAPYKCPVRECRRLEFTGSDELLRLCCEHGLHTGVVTNPFQYTPGTQWGQLLKLDRRIAGGAEFIVTQCGWDMLKLQSLAWYLASHSEYTPRIARLMLLSPPRIERILKNCCPGVRISDDFRRHLEHELSYSKAQFESAQYRRLELQVAGCRLMGFSGVQIVGAETPARVRIVSNRIRQALEEFTDFQQWLEEYNSYLGSADMSPIPEGYQLYDRMLYRDMPENGPIGINPPGEPEATAWERTMLKVRKFFFRHADEESPGHARMLKKLLVSCRGCGRCRLRANSYVCPETCPKRLAEGPCGGVRADGSCELDPELECVHVRATRCAMLLDELAGPAADTRSGC